MAAVVLIYGGGSAFRKAWYGLRSGAPGMEALIVLGAGSGKGGPGPIISELARRFGSLPVPVTIVPGSPQSVVLAQVPVPQSVAVSMAVLPLAT